MKLTAPVVLLFVLLGGALLLAQRPGVASDAEQISPLLPGQVVPDVTFKTLEGGDYNLLEEVAKKPVVLIFYRGGW